MCSQRSTGWPKGREPYGDRASRVVCGREQVPVYTGTEESKQPNGEVRQVSHVRDAKVREMRTADTLLNIIQDRGKRQLPLREMPLWMQVMIMRKRKSIPLCKGCHDDVHHHRPKSKRQGNQRAG